MNVRAFNRQNRCLKNFLVVLFASVSLALSAQPPTWEWAVQCGNSSSDKALDVQVADDGSVYSCGYFNNNGTFGNIQLSPNAYSKEAFLTKLDSTGNFIWAVSGGGAFDDRALGLTIDYQGNIIITGTFWSNCQFGANALNGSADHIFVIKYDPAGNIIWATTGGGQGDDHGYDLVTDAQGNIFITGYLSTHYGPPVCNSMFPNLPVFTYSDSIAFVGRLNSNGQWQWVRTFDGTDVQRDNDIAIDSACNIYVCGGFYGYNRSFGSSTISSTAGSRDIFVTKYDANGNFLWVKSTGDSLDDRANGILYGSDHKLYITGEFRDHVPFGPDTLNNNGGPNGRDIFVAKMDLNGNWIWAKKAGSGSGSESGRAITENNQHNIFVTGNCKGNVDFGNDTSFSTGADSVQVFVAAIDTTGDWKWAVQCGGTSEDRGYGITADSACNVYFCGYFDLPSAMFGPTQLTTYGKKDGFISRLSATCFEYTVDPPPVPPPADCVVDVPNVLTPNGDGINDQLLVTNAGCILYGTWYIYNRWGNLVYSSQDVAAGWNATDNSGKPVSDGVYYYVLDVMKPGTVQEIRQGFLQVIQ